MCKSCTGASGRRGVAHEGQQDVEHECAPERVLQGVFALAAAGALHWARGSGGAPRAVLRNVQARLRAVSPRTRPARVQRFCFTAETQCQLHRDAYQGRSSSSCVPRSQWRRASGGQAGHARRRSCWARARARRRARPRRARRAHACRRSRAGFPTVAEAATARSPPPVAAVSAPQRRALAHQRAPTVP